MGKVLARSAECVLVGWRQLALPRDGPAAAVVPTAHAAAVVLRAHRVHAHDVAVRQKVLVPAHAPRAGAARRASASPLRSGVCVCVF